MAGAVRFLYGLALGISVGIIGSRLLAAASSGTNRRAVWNGHQRPPTRASRQKRSREEATAR
jgi:hypothetical protein